MRKDIIKISLIGAIMLGLSGCQTINKPVQLSEGNAEDLYELALMYRVGDDVDKDHDKFLKYLEMSADKGSIGARYTLALHHDKNGNIEDAVVWYSKISDPKHFHGHAMIRLGDIYRDGELGEIDNDAALKHYENASKLGYVDAMVELAHIHMLKENYEDAYVWYRVAERGGLAQAKLMAEDTAFIMSDDEVLDLDKEVKKKVRLYVQSYLH